jgi:hypothetical protein
MSNRSGEDVSHSSLDGKVMRCKELAAKNTNTPEPKSGGVSAHRIEPAGAQRALLLCGVLGGNPLMPVLLHGVLIVGGPEIRPKTNGLGLRSATPNDDAQRLGLGEGNTAHG